MPKRGRITVSGEITNRSDDSWTDLNAYLLTSPTPITSAAELEEANQSPGETEVGERLFQPGLFEDIGDLEPGQTTDYRLSVPRSDLQISGEEGVYWLGVQVLGANQDGRDLVADGRARTYLPLVSAASPQSELSLVIPLRSKVRREEDGKLVNTERWNRQIGEEGRLDRLLDLGESAEDVPFTWLVDPAVIDAVASLAANDPALSTAPTDEEAAGSSTGQASPSPTEGSGQQEPTQAPTAETRRATEWLSTFRELGSRQAVLALPYGDLDVSSAFRADFAETYQRAAELSALTMEDLRVDAGPVVAPPNGYLSNDALAGLDPAVPVLLSDEAAPNTTRTVIRSDLGNQVLLGSSAVRAGGPAPGPRFSPLALRQRILAEAALHVLTGSPDQPLVVGTPPGWNPGDRWRRASFFSGLDVPWLRLVDIPFTVATADVLAPDVEAYDGALEYPRRQRRNEVPVANLLATDELIEVGMIFEELLTRNDSVDEDIAELAMLTSSVHARSKPNRAVVQAREASQRVHALLSRVRIDGPPFVTMSSEEGTFPVTVINDLKQPVTVGIKANTGTPDLVIASPEPVQLGPGQRASVKLNARSKDIGVHSVTLVPTTVEGQPLGNSVKFSVRSSQVGLVIWVIMAGGAAVLFAAIVVRIVRRVRARKATHGPVLEDANA